MAFSEENGEVEEHSKAIKSKVFEKIFLDLQQDEVELANTEFKMLFYLLLEQFQTQGFLQMDQLMPSFIIQIKCIGELYFDG